MNDTTTPTKLTALEARLPKDPRRMDGHIHRLLSPPQAHVYNSANISINNNSLTALTFDSERYDTEGIHSTSTNTGRLTCQTPGRYRVYCNVAFDAGATGIRLVELRLNGSTIIDLKLLLPTGAGTATAFGCDTEYELVRGDYAEVLVQHTQGVALNVLNAANYSPEFGMRLVGLSQVSP